MKKIIITGFIAALLAGSATSFAVPQNLNNSVKPVQPVVPEKDSLSLQLGEIKNLDILRLNEVSAKAVRHFNRTYRNVEGVKWARLADGDGGFGAYFSADGIRTNVRYDMRGNYECSFREYFEVNLPRNVRHRVKTVYYDFTIRFIKEVNILNNTVYLITLEDNASWKHILVTEYNIDVLIEFFKTAPGSPGN